VSKQTRVHVDISKLERFVEQFGSDLVTRVGILGADASEPHQDSDLTNAEIGVIQEFGSNSANIPPRSFLRMPIEARQKTIVQQLGKEKTKAKIESGDIKGVYNDLGIAAVNVIHGAFASGGFGSWQENAPSTVAAKGSDRPLIDTRQLQRSISHDVIPRSKL